MKRFMLLIIALLIVTALAAAASDNTARQLVDHLYVGSGQMPILDMTIEADINADATGQGGGNLQPYTKDKIFFKSPNKLRIEKVGVQDQNMEILFRDGSMYYIYFPNAKFPSKKGQDFPEPTLSIPFYIQKYPQDSNKQYVCVGQETVDNVTTEVVRILDPSEPEKVFTVWIDKSRWVPLKLQFKRPASRPGEKPIEKTIFYRNIQKLADGRFFPLELDRYSGNNLVEVIVYKKVSINSGLPDSLFKPMQKFEQ